MFPAFHPLFEILAFIVAVQVYLMFFNLAGVAVNFVAAIVFALLRQKGRCLGAILGGVLFGLVGFGLCLGSIFLLETFGAPLMQF